MKDIPEISNPTKISLPVPPHTLRVHPASYLTSLISISSSVGIRMLPHKVFMQIKYVNENKALCPIVPTGILNFWTFIF